MPEHRLAHIIHQTAKMLVALLEKEYGIGRHKQPPAVAVVHRVEVWGIERQEESS